MLLLSFVQLSIGMTVCEDFRAAKGITVREQKHVQFTNKIKQNTPKHKEEQEDIKINVNSTDSDLIARKV